MTKPYNIISSSIMGLGPSASSTSNSELSYGLFLEQVSGLLQDSKRGARTDHVTDKIFELTKNNPNLTKEFGFPIDWKSIRNEIVLAASVKTDMTNGTTTFDPRPEDPDGKPFTIESHNNVVKSSKKGAQDPYETEDVNVVADTDNHTAYGPPGAYIDTGDPRGRDLHGGGTCAEAPLADEQGWCPTKGCTRGQNKDVKALAEKINDFKSRHPGVKISYERF